MVTDHLTREAVAEQAVRLADAEGIEAITIRRLAQRLGVTPMALYWHFKNKDELLIAIADHALSDVKATRKPGDPWHHQLRAMVEALVGVMRQHPSLAALLQLIDKQSAASFTRAANDALALLAEAGFDVEEGYWIASYLMHGAIGLVVSTPTCPTTMTEDEAREWRRQKRLGLEKLPSALYPMMVEFAKTLEKEPDSEHYYTFGIDLMLSGVMAVAEGRRSRP